MSTASARTTNSRPIPPISAAPAFHLTKEERWTGIMLLGLTALLLGVHWYVCQINFPTFTISRMQLFLLWILFYSKAITATLSPTSSWCRASSSPGHSRSAFRWRTSATPATCPATWGTSSQTSLWSSPSCPWADSATCPASTHPSSRSPTRSSPPGRAGTGSWHMHSSLQIICLLIHGERERDVSMNKDKKIVVGYWTPNCLRTNISSIVWHWTVIYERKQTLTEKRWNGNPFWSEFCPKTHLETN